MPYRFNPPPDAQDLLSVLKWAETELQEIEKSFQETTELELRPISAAPIRPREGMIIYADGSNYNPGDGEGVYVFKNGLFVPLGRAASTAPTNIRKFLTSGTYPTVSNGTVKVLCWLKGGGGSGGGSNFNQNNFGGGGGEAAQAYKLVDASALSGQTVTIGAGGAGLAAATDTNGNAGATTSVGSVCTAAGGGAGRSGGTGGTGGSGGNSGTADIIIPGIAGDSGGDASGTIPIGPNGGGGGGGSPTTSAAANSGAGGGGGWRFQGSGNGGSGYAYFIEYGAI